MSALGGYGPFPRRFGASRGRALEAIVGSLLGSIGTAYDTSQGTAVAVKAHATGRALFAAQEQNRKLANQFDPQRLTDMLPRWERIYAISPPVTATPVDRRATLTTIWRRIGRMPTLGNVIKTLNEVLPNTFSSLVFTASNATGVQTHTNVAVDLSGQGGIVTTGDGLWGSSVHHIAIKTVCPAWMRTGGLAAGAPLNAYYAEVGSISGPLSLMLPAWVTFAAFLDGSGGAGFFLDDASNLDGERFRL